MPNEAVTNPSFEEPRKVYIGELLSMNNPSIVVPDWQRSYSWKSEHLEAFWNDLISFSESQGTPATGEYFLGAVVIVRKDDGRLQLLDGQQRLATSAILLSVIRDEIARTNELAAAQLQDNFLSGFDHNENIRVNKLTMNVYDRDYFRRLILDRRVADYQPPQAEIPSHRNILFSRELFETRLENYLNGSADRYGAVQKIRRVLLNHLCVIQAISSDQDSAADVFEVLNDRGIGLSTPDLLRNLVLRRANEGEHETITELWRSVLSLGTDNEIKDFLRHFWVSKYGDVKSQSLYREMKAVINNEDISSLFISESLNNSVENYRRIKSADFEGEELSSKLEILSHLPASSKALLPALLAIIEKLGEGDSVEPTRVLIESFIRHTLIVGRDNSSLENTVYRASRRLREDGNIIAFIDQIRSLRQSDEAVRDSFSRISIQNQKFRRFLLVQIEKKMRETEEIDVARPHRVHVEHIYPQNPQEEHRWDNHSQYINRMGNLTLLSGSINMQIQNNTFEQKQERFAESELVMTRSLSGLEIWNSAAVDDRQHQMAERVVEIFPA